MAFLFDRAPKRGCCELRISFSDGVWLLKGKPGRNAKRVCFLSNMSYHADFSLLPHEDMTRFKRDERGRDSGARRLSEFQEEAFYRSYAWAVPPDI